MGPISPDKLELGNLNQQLKNVDAEIQDCQNKLERMKKRIPLTIFICVVFALVFPFLPGSRGRRPMIETMEYTEAIVFLAIVFSIIYPISYLIKNNKLQKK